MKLKAKSFHSPDVERIWEWIPPNSENVRFLLEVEIGEVDDDSKDIFQIVIATPLGLQGIRPRKGHIISDRALLVVSEYNWRAILDWMDNILMRCSSKTWLESVRNLQKYFQWEYEDYHPPIEKTANG